MGGGDDYVVGLTKDGSVVGWGNLGNDHGSLSFFGWNGVTAIAAGRQFTLGLIGGGEDIYGKSPSDGNYSVAASYSLLSHPCKTISAGEYHSLALRTDGVLIAKGIGTFGQTSVGGMTNVKRAWAAARGSFVQLNNDRIFAAGRNTYGQLGDGTTDDRTTPVEATQLMDLLAG